MKRKIAALLAACALLLSLSACTQAGRRTAAQKFLNKDIVAISDCAREVLETGVVPEDVHFDGVEEIHYAAPDWVGFITGRRLADDYIEVGFYYSPDNEPLPGRGEAMELIQDPVNGDKYTCTIEGRDGTMQYYTEYMQVGWYYYEYKFDFLKN